MRWNHYESKIDILNSKFKDVNIVSKIHHLQNIVPCLWTALSCSAESAILMMLKMVASFSGPKMPPGILRRNFFMTLAMVLRE